MDKKLTQGGPGDQYLGGGKVDTGEWFTKFPLLEDQIKNQEIWFCGAPFQMIYTSTNGQFLPCSWAQESDPDTGEPYGPNIKDVSCKDYFNKDETLNHMREEMLTPDDPLKLVNKICRNCRYQEEHYGRSRRQASLKLQTNDKRLWPRMRNTVERFKKIESWSHDETGWATHSDAFFKERIFEVQVKAYGNQCNLDCYMCIPYDSSIRLQTMHHEDLKDQNIFSEASMERIPALSINTIDDITDQIAEIAPYIYNLKLIGGEPLVMKKFYGLLEKIVESGEAENIMVKYQTNMSILEFEKLKISKFIPHFGLFEFTVSLDSIGKANNYIRRRSNWDEIVENIKHVKQYENVWVNINGAISFLSVLRFHELIKWFGENKALFHQINWSNIRGPGKLCANVLPKPLKEKLIPLYEGFPDIQQVLRESPHNTYYGNRVEGDDDYIDIQDTFKYLLMNDKHYKGTKWEMDLFKVFPELEEYYIPDIQEIEL